MAKKEVKKKFDELYDQIKEKKIQMEKLGIEIKTLEESLEFLKSGEYDEVFKKANEMLNRYYLYYFPNDYIFLFGYCDNVAETSCGVEITRSGFTIGKIGDRISYDEKYTFIITYDSYFDNVFVLDGQQSKIIQDEIDRTIHREQTTKDLYNYIENFYNTTK